MEYSHVYGRDMYLITFLTARRIRADMIWLWELELAAESWEAATWHGVG
jgi:hypothetical protein